MFGFGPRRRQTREATRYASAGERLVYAVGDIHGRLDLLDQLLMLIAADVESSAALADSPGVKPVLVFLGDYIDRGPESRGVIERLLQLKGLGTLDVRLLKGNHEEAMSTFLDDPGFGLTWLQFGGGATLASYGVTPPPLRPDDRAWEAARDALDQVLPADHRAFLGQLEIFVEFGDYVFVHAGLRPGVPLQAQTEQDMLWIRHEFLNERRPFEKVVVHGHTPEPEPFIGANRLGVDTGAYATGVLTAVRLSGPDRSVIQARIAPGGEV